MSVGRSRHLAWLLSSLGACGNVVIPASHAATDAAADRDRQDVPVVAPDSMSDVVVPDAVDVIEDRPIDVPLDRGDASVPDAAPGPTELVDLYANVLDTDPSRSDDFVRPFWFAFAAMYTEIRDDVTIDVPGGRCRSTVVVDSARRSLGSGRARVVFYDEPFVLEQPNWYRTGFVNTGLPPETRVELSFSGTPTLAPFRVMATWPEPTTYLGPLRAPRAEVLVVSVGTPLTIRFVPTDEQVLIRIDGLSRLPERDRILTHCLVDGRSGTATIPSAILSRYPHDSPPRNGEFAFYSVDTVRMARVTVGGVEAEFRARAVSMTFPVMFSR
jgi:hypothetical protein